MRPLSASALAGLVVFHFVLGSETVRRRFERRLTEREHSLSALFRVGEAASSPGDADGFRLGLALLGELVDARSVSFLRLDPTGDFEADPLTWSRGETQTTGDLETARSVLASRRMRVLEGARSAVYYPLCVGTLPTGVLVVERRTAGRIEELQLRTIAAVGTQLALSAENLRLIDDLREKKISAEAANRAKSEFLANMSHEIRTPMTAIMGYLEIMADPEAMDQRAEYTESVRANGESLLAIINDILDLSQIEAGELGLRIYRAVPAEIVSKVIAGYEAQAAARKLRLDLEYQGDIPSEMRTDPGRLEQILTNLVDNAVKFTEHGSVTLSVAIEEAGTRGEQLRIDVVDTGHGISPGAQRRIFEPFVQADSSSTRTQGGTGMGLAISNRLATLLGGSLEFSSKLGQGSQFTLRVSTRLGTEAAELLCEEEAPNPDKPPERSPDVKPRILLAEDGIDNRRIIRLLLQKGGMEVDLAVNGREAFETGLGALRRGEPYDLIFMDIDMPVMDGHEATRRLRAQGYHAPIVALTAHALPGDREKCLDAGCDDYMTKPVNRQRLVSIADKHIGSPSDS